MYDRATVQGATFDMHGQLYRGHANASALFSCPVGSESDDPGSSPSVVPLRRAGKKMRVPLLGLAKSVYYFGICVVYTKTIIHLSVGESGGYLPHGFAAW